MQTPLLLLIWRRPHALRQVINAIRPASPSFLFVACDGPAPSNPMESVLVEATRSVVDSEVDWPCQVEKLYSETNLGCRISVSRAITWFFEHNDEGIILEDDCVPHPDFFLYCETLLSRYRDDKRVWCISGSNFQNGRWRGDGSYYFSSYPHCWGWASWRRCWQHYDSELKLLTPLLEHQLDRALFPDSVERLYWLNLWKRLIQQGKPDSWAYRWVFTCLVNGGLTALPNRNLVVNIGFDLDATHTVRNGSASIPTALGSGLPNLDPPSFILRDVNADRYSFDHAFGGSQLRFPNMLLAPVRKIFKFLSGKIRS